jgi:transposase
MMPGRPPVDAERIKVLHAQGVSAYAIADRVGCSRGMVYGVLRTKTQGVKK